MQGTGREEAGLSNKKINNMTETVRVLNQKAPISVPSAHSESGEMLISTLTVQNLGGQYADSYAIQLYGEMARQTFQPGELLMAVLKFRAVQSGENVYQKVPAEEIVRMNQVNNLNNVF